MSIEKTGSIVLSAAPYRESSLLVHLFTREHGRINAIAKGVRRPDRRAVPIERGYLIDHFTYIRPHRELQQITECQIRDHFPGIRGNLEKTAVRDVLIDMALSVMRDADPHADMFDCYARFLSDLDSMKCDTAAMLLHLSRHVFGMAARLGVGADFTVCSVCGRPFDSRSSVCLMIDKGLVRHESCGSSLSVTDRMIGGSAARLFSFADGTTCATLPVIPGREALRMVHCAVDYCRYHLDIRRNMQSLGFLDNLAAMV